MSTRTNFRFISIPKPVASSNIIQIKNDTHSKNIRNDRENSNYSETKSENKNRSFSKFRKKDSSKSNKITESNLAPIHKLRTFFSASRSEIKQTDSNLNNSFTNASKNLKTANRRPTSQSNIISSPSKNDACNDSLDSKRRSYKKPQYYHYSITSQILNLPGGVKREEDEIKDDANNSARKLNNQSYIFKLDKDHKSNIDCLPGKLKNKEQASKTRSVSANKFQTNDIFNLKPPKIKSQHNQYQITQKRLNKNANLIPKSNNLDPNRKSRRPDYIPDMLESHIELK